MPHKTPVERIMDAWGQLNDTEQKIVFQVLKRQAAPSKPKRVKAVPKPVPITAN